MIRSRPKGGGGLGGVGWGGLGGVGGVGLGGVPPPLSLMQQVALFAASAVFSRYTELSRRLITEM